MSFVAQDTLDVTSQIGRIQSNTSWDRRETLEVNNHGLLSLFCYICEIKMLALPTCKRKIERRLSKTTLQWYQIATSTISFLLLCHNGFLFIDEI